MDITLAPRLKHKSKIHYSLFAGPWLWPNSNIQFSKAGGVGGIDAPNVQKSEELKHS